MWPAIAIHVVGGIMRANAARRAAEAQAAQDEFNAKLADMAQGDALARGQVDEGNVRRGVSEKISTQRAQLAASGVDVQSGSALDALSSQRARGELAALVVRSNAAREAWGLAGVAQNYRNKAAYARQSGSEAFLAELIGTGTNVAEDASKLSGSPGITTPLIRVGEPTVPDAWMNGDPLVGYNPQGDGMTP